MREIAWTDEDGVMRESLGPVWQTDIPAALRAIGAPQRILDTLVMQPPRTNPLTWTERGADHVTIAVEAAWEPELRAYHEACLQVSHPAKKNETDWARRPRFEATYDPAAALSEFGGPPTPEEECDEPDDVVEVFEVQAAEATPPTALEVRNPLDEAERLLW